MVHGASRLLLFVAIAAAWTLCPTAAEARHRTSPDLFYNYYVAPGPCQCGDVGAELYVCPRPTPAMVGHTWITYQPLMSHEYLYRHKRLHVRRNPGAGPTVTCVKYGHNPLPSLLPTWADGRICKHIFVNPFADYGKYYRP